MIVSADSSVSERRGKAGEARTIGSLFPAFGNHKLDHSALDARNGHPDPATSVTILTDSGVAIDDRVGGTVDVGDQGDRDVSWRRAEPVHGDGFAVGPGDDAL